jgi:hypothetical protein
MHQPVIHALFMHYDASLMHNNCLKTPSIALLHHIRAYNHSLLLHQYSIIACCRHVGVHFGG